MPRPARTSSSNFTYTPAISRQIWLRIKVSVAAYAYELWDETIIPDAEFDKLCLGIDPSVSTNRPKLDEFFRTRFDPSTGMWIKEHPELRGIIRIYETVWRKS